MRSITFAFFVSFALGAAAKPLKEDDSISVIPVSAVRPDWTNIPQGQRVLPRLQTTPSVTIVLESSVVVLMRSQNS
jgi:hypothetical protein